MRITLNGFELSRQANDQTPVGQVLAEIKDEIARSGNIVTEVKIDGFSLPQGWQRRRRLAEPATHFKSMDLQMSTVDMLKRATLDNAVQLIRQLENRMQPLALKFRLGDEVLANNELAILLENLKLILGGLDHVSRPDRAAEPNQMRERIEQAANQFLPTLDRIYKAQSSGDYVAIADELEYELPDHFRTWSLLLNQLQATEATVSLPENA